MFPVLGSARIFLCRQPTDMRKSFDTLAALASNVFEENPLSGALFVFLNIPRNRVKILYFDRDGYCLWSNYLNSYYTSLLF